MSGSFVIDNMVIGQLAQLGEGFAAWPWPKGLLKTARYVASTEVPGDPRRQKCVAQPWLEIVESPADGAASRFEADELVPNGTRSPVDAGELACIGVAYALGLPFVTQDKQGLVVAAAALGSAAVMLPYDLWLQLEAMALIDAADRRRLSELTWKNHRQLVLCQPRRTTR